MKRIFLVIGLVTVLIGVGWLVRAWTTLRVNARTARMNDDIVNMFEALQKYKENVGSYPVGSNADIVKALKGKNAKNVIILMGRKTELNEKGEFVDQWKTPLRIYFSDNGILVRSAGPNQRFDDSTAMDCDDYFRSN
jgi:hypothetical protein